jgi:hypothetical protein
MVFFQKAPLRVGREKIEIPENLFDDSQENKSTVSKKSLNCCIDSISCN